MHSITANLNRALFKITFTVDIVYINDIYCFYKEVMELIFLAVLYIVNINRIIDVDLICSNI
jgi:hypothetical protein